MKPVDFIVDTLKELHVKFPNCHIKYEFDELINVHIVEVLPLSFYENEEYMEYESDLFESFSELFPSEELLFVSEDSLNRVTHPSFEIHSEQIGELKTDFLEFPTPSFIGSHDESYQPKEMSNFALAA